jgi:hypothetical protein
MPPQVTHPETFVEVLEEWSCTWICEDMRLSGDDGWLEVAIRDNTLVAVTDGSYMRSLYPHMNSCAFILECTQCRGRLTGAFSEQTIVACSYRGELLGLMAIHLILLSWKCCRQDATCRRRHTVSLQFWPDGSVLPILFF